MKAWAIKIVPVLVIVLLLTIYHASADQESRTVLSEESHDIVIEGEVTGVSATAYGIFDAETGEVISGHNTDEVLPIASITKLITAGAVLSGGDRESEVTVTDEDVATYGRSGRLSSGLVYTNYELLFPLLLESSNDASSVYERASEGKVVEVMNRLAIEAGGVETKLTDASGLSDRNVSTVKELALVTTKLYKDEPHIFDISRLSKRAGPYLPWANNSPVLGPDYLGGKHGFTESAGRTLVALFNETVGEEERVVGYVLLGSDDLVSDTTKLREFVRNSARVE
jgi:D-alanyl-D-alanine carboxypeptidase